jgi:dTMP kinase
VSSPSRGPRPEPGLFLVLEGIEGSGKTTQARLLMDWLQELGLSARHAREPGGTPVGEAIREILLDREDLSIAGESELLLMLAARAAFVREVVRPTLAEGRIMVADRFDFSTFAYQGFGRGLDLGQVRSLNDFATGGLSPDLVVVLDLAPEEGRDRQRKEGKPEDRIEAAGAAFLARVAGGYRQLCEESAFAVRVDARPHPHEVHTRIREILRARFPEPFLPARGWNSGLAAPRSPSSTEPDSV